jgi:hypothetical protein
MPNIFDRTREDLNQVATLRLTDMDGDEPETDEDAHEGLVDQGDEDDDDDLFGEPPGSDPNDPADDDW